MQSSKARQDALKANHDTVKIETDGLSKAIVGAIGAQGTSEETVIIHACNCFAILLHSLVEIADAQQSLVEIHERDFALAVQAAVDEQMQDQKIINEKETQKRSFIGKKQNTD
jgi:hypothetical protein